MVATVRQKIRCAVHFLPCRWHLAKRERGGLDGGDARRSRGQLEEHLLSRCAQGVGDASSGRKPARVHTAALSHTLTHRKHQEPRSQWWLLPTVGVMAAATQVSTSWCLFPLHIHFSTFSILFFLSPVSILHPPLVLVTSASCCKLKFRQSQLGSECSLYFQTNFWV